MDGYPDALLIADMKSGSVYPFIPKFKKYIPPAKNV